MPTQDTDVDELIKKCLELNTITYGIKQAIRNKKTVKFHMKLFFHFRH